jgi:hypothetical protein
MTNPQQSHKFTVAGRHRATPSSFGYQKICSYIYAALDVDTDTRLMKMLAYLLSTNSPPFALEFVARFLVIQSCHHITIFEYKPSIAEPKTLFVCIFNVPDSASSVNSQMFSAYAHNLILLSIIILAFLVGEYKNQCAVLLLSWIIVDNSSSLRFERKRVPNFYRQVRLVLWPNSTREKHTLFLVNFLAFLSCLIQCHW